MNEDAELLRRFAETHAEEAFAQLVQRHLGLVYHTALRRTNGDAHLAQDIAQQVFTTLAKDARTLSRHAVLAGWLYVTTRHLAANAMRAEHRRKQREEAAHRLQETLPATSSAAWDQLRPELDAVMEELSGPDRDAVLLRFFEDQSYAHIGATLDVSEDAARMRVDRALDKLRGLLAHRGIESTAAALGAVLAGHAAGAAPTGLATSVTGAALGSLTVASVGVATAGTFWTFMTTTKTLAGVAGAIACMGIGAGVYEVSGFSSNTAALGAADARYTTLVARLNSSETESAQLRAKLAEQTTPTSNASTGTSTAASSSGQQGQAVPANASTGVKGTMDIVFADPEYQRLSTESFRAGLRLTNDPFYRKAKLSAETISSLEALMIEQQQVGTDVMAAARAQGMSISDVQFSKVAGDAYKIIEEQMKALLGADVMTQLKTFQSSSSARRAVDQLASGLYYTDTPLTLAQGEELTKIVRAETKQVRSGMVSVAETNWDAVIPQSTKILSPEQTEVLRMLGDRETVQRRVTERHNSLLNSAAILSQEKSVQSTKSGTAQTP